MIGSSSVKPITDRTSMIWKTFSSRVVSRPAIAMTSISESQPAIHSAAIDLDGVLFMGADAREGVVEREAGIGDLAALCNVQNCGCSDAVLRAKALITRSLQGEKTDENPAAGRMVKTTR